jgi:hypothetical protein
MAELETETTAMWLCVSLNVKAHLLLKNIDQNSSYHEKKKKNEKKKSCYWPHHKFLCRYNIASQNHSGRTVWPLSVNKTLSEKPRFLFSGGSLDRSTELHKRK